MSNMHEQPQYKITPEQGWAKMKPILEEAMPTSRPSGRSPFVWWTTTTVIVVAFSSLLFLSGTTSSADKSSTIISTTSTSTSVVPAQKENSTPEPSGASSIGSESSETQSDIKTNPAIVVPAKTTNKPSAIHSKSATYKAKKQSAVIPMAMVDPAMQSGDPLVNQSGEVISATGNTDVAVVDNPAARQKVITHTDLRNERIIDPLQSLSELAFESPDMASQSIPSGTVTKAKRQVPLIEPNVAISGFAGAQGGVGWSGAAGAGVNLGRRLSLSTSLGYLSFNPDASLLGGNKQLDVSAGSNAILNYDPAYTGNEVYVESNAITKTAGYDDINSLVDKVTQWQINAGLKWKINRRFFTEIGAQIGWNTKAFSSYPIIELDPLTGPGVRFDNSLSDFNVIRTTTTSLYAGLGYRVGQHIDVFANWTHGLDNYILNDTPTSTTDQFSSDRTDYIRGLSLGLRYTL